MNSGRPSGARRLHGFIEVERAAPAHGPCPCADVTASCGGRAPRGAGRRRGSPSAPGCRVAPSRGSSWTRSKRGTTPSSPSSGRSRAAAAASSPRRRTAAKAFVFALPGGQAVVADRRRSNATCARRRGRAARLNGLCKLLAGHQHPAEDRGHAGRRVSRGVVSGEMICGKLFAGYSWIRFLAERSKRHNVTQKVLLRQLNNHSNF